MKIRFAIPYSPNTHFQARNPPNHTILSLDIWHMYLFTSPPPNLQIVPKKHLKVFLWYFLKLIFYSKIKCISTSFKKEIHILSQIVKKYRPVNLKILNTLNNKMNDLLWLLKKKGLNSNFKFNFKLNYVYHLYVNYT